MSYIIEKPKLPDKMQMRYVINELKSIPVSLELEKSSRLVEELLTDARIKAMLNATNTMLVGYLKYNDHGWSHAVIVARNAVKILKILLKKGIQPSMVAYKFGDLDDSFFITLIASFLHDVGNMVHRSFHWGHSVHISYDLIWDYINRYYKDADLNRKWVIFAHIANAIYSHDERVKAFTIEASAIKVGDGCDMAAGRSRKPYTGKVDIHSVSAWSITEVEITEGDKKPLKIRINMTNPAGIFQVEEILMKKVEASILVNQIEYDIRVNDKPIKLVRSPV